MNTVLCCVAMKSTTGAVEGRTSLRESRETRVYVQAEGDAGIDGRKRLALWTERKKTVGKKKSFTQEITRVVSEYRREKCVGPVGHPVDRSGRGYVACASGRGLGPPLRATIRFPCATRADEWKRAAHTHVSSADSPPPPPSTTRETEPSIIFFINFVFLCYLFSPVRIIHPPKYRGKTDDDNRARDNIILILFVLLLFYRYYNIIIIRTRLTCLSR